MDDLDKIANFTICLFERFGDELYGGDKTLSFAVWSAHGASELICPALQVCDLTNAQTLSAIQVDLGTLMNQELELPQKWGLAIQKHPANFQGIKYRSRFNGKTCLALFERDEIAKSLEEVFQGNLSDLQKAVDWLDKHRISLF